MLTLQQALDLAVQQHRAGNLGQAEQLYRQILQVEPNNVDALQLLGALAGQDGRLDLAGTCLQKALSIRPDLAVAHSNLGSVLHKQGKFEGAAECYRRALRFAPKFADAHANLGMVLNDLRMPDEAVASYRRALQFAPQQAESHNKIGLIFKEQGKLEEAVASYREGLRIDPNNANIHNNMGIALLHLGQLDDALAAYRTALQLKPDSPGFHSNLIGALYYHPAYDALAIRAECRRWNERFAEPLQKEIRPWPNNRDPERRLRIGYVSPDFRDHVLAFFIVPLLTHHDHGPFEIYCYASVPRPDGVTQLLKGHADVWRDIAGLSDAQSAELIRADQIDILVELTMHTANNRLLVFARKPAPVQVTWLGINGTTGLTTMDYRLTDPYLDPETSDEGRVASGEETSDAWRVTRGEEEAVGEASLATRHSSLATRHYSEESVRLPETFWCYDPLTDRPEVGPLPVLANGYITFGCMNNFFKVNDGALSLWAKVLHAVPNSRLLMLAPRGADLKSARQRVTERLAADGIPASRIEFADRRPRLEYLHLYHRIDVSLDPLPYNGHTTSLDAFWMGVPTVTMLGRTVVGREGYSQLCNLGLQEFAAQTPEEYVATAARLAADLPRLEQLRGSLRQRLLSSPLGDAPRFARNMEHAFRQMWRRWCETRLAATR